MTPVPWAAWRKQQGYGERSLASYINIRTTTLVKPTQHLCVASQSQYGVDDGVGGLPRPLLKLGKGGVAHLEPLGSGCRIRKGEQRHDNYYHAFIARARAQPQDGLARCGQLLRALLSDGRDRSHRANALRGRAATRWRAAYSWRRQRRDRGSVRRL